MIPIDIISGFLGAGKTTFINRLLSEQADNARSLLVENEFGEVSVDSRVLGDRIRTLEIGSGCICCTLQGDFVRGMARAVRELRPDRILVEPTGAARLSEVRDACARSGEAFGGRIRSDLTVVNAESCLTLYEMGGGLFRSQLQEARYIAVSAAELVEAEELAECRRIIRELNPSAPICLEPWTEGTAGGILEKAAALWELSALQKRPDGPLLGRLRRPDADLTFLTVADPDWRAFRDPAHLAEELGSGKYGAVCRVKGCVRTEDGLLRRADYIAGGPVRLEDGPPGSPAALSVIGTDLEEEALRRLFAARE